MTTGYAVVVQPSNVHLRVQAGETLMAAAARSGYRWPTVCDGMAECGVCFVRLRDGADWAVPAASSELRALEPITARYPDAPQGSLRLACQLTLRGEPVVVYRPGVRAA